MLLTAPGRVVADTKSYLYLDPGRLLERAPSMWDPNIGLGTVTHQNIGYLLPMGPYYWLMHFLGVPAWVSQRIWFGSILMFAALGMLYLFRTLHVRGPGVVVGTLVFMLSPYTITFASRLSVILLPWAGLPLMLALVIRALRDDGWKYPALFAIVVQVVGSVNATALVFVGIVPALWVLYAWLVTREADWRRIVTTVAKIAALTILASVWWIVGLAIQSSYGLDVLKFTETLETVSQASLPVEVLRGLGYWFFYGRDTIGPWIEPSVRYTQDIWLLVVSYGIPVLALLERRARALEAPSVLRRGHADRCRGVGRRQSLRQPVGPRARCSRDSPHRPTSGSRCGAPAEPYRSSRSAWRCCSDSV